MPPVRQSDVAALPLSLPGCWASSTTSPCSVLHPPGHHLYCAPTVCLAELGRVLDRMSLGHRTLESQHRPSGKEVGLVVAGWG